MFALGKLTKRRTPAVAFADIAEKILGPDYDLSLVLAGNKLLQELNRKYRRRDHPTNILSFPLEKKRGEIFINLEDTKGFDPQHLFIHGLLHLKGMTHGSKMEGAEKKWLAKFSFNDQKPSRRRGYRDNDNAHCRLPKKTRG